MCFGMYDSKPPMLLEFRSWPGYYTTALFCEYFYYNLGDVRASLHALGGYHRLLLLQRGWHLLGWWKLMSQGFILFTYVRD